MSMVSRWEGSNSRRVYGRAQGFSKENAGRAGSVSRTLDAVQCKRSSVRETGSARLRQCGERYCLRKTETGSRRAAKLRPVAVKMRHFVGVAPGDLLFGDAEGGGDAFALCGARRVAAVHDRRQHTAVQPRRSLQR